jgi:poly(A) polymerase
VRSLFRNCRLIGRRFRLAHVRFGREVVEVATFRAVPDEASDFDEDEMRVSAEGQVTRDNVYGTIEQDAERRDFTVNALYFDPRDETVIDYVNGVADLKRKQLVTIGNPMERLREDPVRMLRAVRFAAKLGFGMHEETESAMRELASLLHHVPPARMLDEVLKLFHSGHAVETMDMLRDAGLFRHLFPFTEQCLVEGGPNISTLALANTDQRIREGKPVIPAFLFASMLWEPLRTDTEKLVDTGMPQRAAEATATTDLLRDQSQYVSLPRRLTVVMKEIWSLQSRLERRQPRTIMSTLQHKRFRAAYDFLLLRVETGEASREIADWWTSIQDCPSPEQHKMIKALATPPRSGRRRRRRRRAA